MFAKKIISNCAKSDYFAQQTGRSVLGLPSGLEPMALAPPEPSHAIQEQNLKAALEASSIFVETLESDGALAVEEIEREVILLLLGAPLSIQALGSHLSSARRCSQALSIEVTAAAYARLVPDR
jgi:hypothetical protein